MKKIELRNIHLLTGNQKGDVAWLDVPSCAMFKDKFTRVRGEIIEQALAIMAELDYFFEIHEIQVPQSKPGKEFMDKWTLFRNSLHKLPKLKSTTKVLRRNVHDAIEKRDIYAHGELGFTNNQPEITYKKEGEIVTEKITDEMLINDLKFFEEVISELRALNNKGFVLTDIEKLTKE